MGRPAMLCHTCACSKRVIAACFSTLSLLASRPREGTGRGTCSAAASWSWVARPRGERPACPALPLSLLLCRLPLPQRTLLTCLLCISVGHALFTGVVLSGPVIVV